MKLTTKTLFEAYQDDASNRSELAINRTGFYYIGALYPTNAVNGERIALVFWSSAEACFTSRKVFKLDITTLTNKMSVSKDKGILPKSLLGSIIEITKIIPIQTNYISYPYCVEWNILTLSADPKHFYKTEAELEAVNEEVSEGDIFENSSEDEMEIPDEIEDEQFLEELEQLLYDEHISIQGESDYESELLQLLWDEQREDRPETGFENQGEEL